MDSIILINAVFLCLVNGSFMIAGIFLNSVVIVTLKRSSQLRKKLCYFMILILSCFDLAVVMYSHSIRILWAISLSTGTYQQYEDRFSNWGYVIVYNLVAFSVSTLIVMNVERYLALKYPFFHHTAVTKRRLGLSLAVLMTIVVSVSPLFYFYRKTFGYAIISVFIFFTLSLFAYLNYNIFVIARSKREGRRATMSFHQERKRWKLNVKNISTCGLAVGCFLIFSFPTILHYILRHTDALPNERFVRLSGLWSSTFMAMNSTFNCVIFFWKHSILRCEGMKTIKRCLLSRS